MNKKFSKELEKKFQKDLGAEKTRAARDVSVTAAVIFTVFGIVDLVFLTYFNLHAWLVRSVVLSTTLYVVYLALWRKDIFLRYYNLLIIFEYLVFGLSVQGIALVSPPEHMSWKNYHPALILVTFALYTTTYLNPASAFFGGFLLLVSYFSMEIFTKGTGAASQTGFISNFVFLISANAVALISKKIMSRFSRSAFLLKRSLLEDISERKILEDKLREMASQDQLTGVLNRWRFMELAEHEHKRHRRSKKSMCIIMMDLDRFKNINDTFGHAAGDIILNEFAKNCLQQLRESDIVGRYGGEEFLALLPETSITTAMEIAERIRTSFQKMEIKSSGQIIPATVSMGVAVYDAEECDLEQFISRADSAMYEAKRSGRNTVRAHNVLTYP